MDLYMIISLWFLFWIIIYCTHHTLIHHKNQIYLKCVQLIGLEVKLMYISLFWSRLNYRAREIAYRKEIILKKWFDVGIIVTLFLIPVSIFLVLQTVVNFSFNDRKKTSSLQPYLPGLNLPLDQTLYYLIALLVSSIFHECGHLIAALSEGIRVNGIGLMLFIAVPIAFVDLPEEEVRKLSLRARLRIFCGGVWHNIILGLFTITIIVALPYLLGPLYRIDQGVEVVGSTQQWGAEDDYAILSGDVIVSVNRDCEIKNTKAWKECFRKLLIAERADGYCVPDTFLTSSNIKQNEQICCPENINRHLCFGEYHSDVHYCLPVREAIEISARSCNSSISCKEQYTCIKAVDDGVGKKVIEIQRTAKVSFLFWGHPRELYSSLILIDYVPKLSFLPTLLIYRLETLLRYFASFSLALAFLNAMPCYMMDGKWITQTFLSVIAGKTSRRGLDKANNVISFIGTILVFLCIVLGFSQMVKTSGIKIF